jgi:phage terminase small subunit
VGNIKYDEDVKGYTQKQLMALKEAAKKKFIDELGAVSVKVLARVARVPQSYVRKWMKEENWKDLIVEEKGDKVTLSEETKKAISEDADQFDLSEEERLFCFHYLKTFNATTAAARAGYSSAFCYKKGCDLMNTPKIQSFLKHIKSCRDTELFIDSIDIIRQYANIAFADITDVVIFKGDELRMRSNTEVDGKLISELAQTKDGGFKIKLYDKLEALKRLERFYIFDFEKEKLKLARAKVLMDIEQTRNTNKANADIGLLKQKMEARGAKKNG